MNAWLNLPEFTWPVSCSIVADHYGGRRATMAIGPIMVVHGEKIFNFKALRWLESAILKFYFARLKIKDIAGIGIARIVREAEDRENWRRFCRGATADRLNDLTI